MSADNWIDPLDFCASRELGDYWALLYSGMNNQGSGSHSFLASHPQSILNSGNFDDINTYLNNNQRLYGYLSYESASQLEKTSKTHPLNLILPPFLLFSPRKTTFWDHNRQVMKQDTGYESKKKSTSSSIELTELTSPMSKQEYLEIVRQTIAQIHAGNFYQANITRKFYGRLKNPIDSFALFRRLADISPSVFSAFMKLGDTIIISSSPEGFLAIDEAGKITVRPIKGTAKRGESTEKDEQIRRALQMSAKDRAENLMIVDLMRNDLSRCAKPGSVQVESLNELHTYATVHQLISTISAQKSDQSDVMDVIKACFPAGSMTGAPKIAAMNWCAEQERYDRGIYSGAIGWMGRNSCDLSVIIRTIIIQGDYIEFQVGGGIVADSNPEAEWRETLTKATAICKALNITPQQLEAL